MLAFTLGLYKYQPIPLLSIQNLSKRRKSMRLSRSIQVTCFDLVMGLKGIVAVLSVWFSLAQGYGQKETVEETVKNFQVRSADLGW